VSEHAETIRRLGREQFLPQMQEMAGFVGYGMLADTDAEKGLDLAFFETKDTMEAGHRSLDAMSPPPGVAGIRRTSVEMYEVAVHEVEGEPVAARASLLEGPPEGIDEGIRKAQDEILPRARQLDGWTGVLYLADRATGKTMILTLWESPEALRASEEAATRLRQEAADAGSETIAGVERYEVLGLQIATRAATR
jgi:heme-degrading monooxygenase HmoA